MITLEYREDKPENERQSKLRKEYYVKTLSYEIKGDNDKCLQKIMRLKKT